MPHPQTWRGRVARPRVARTAMAMAGSFAALASAPGLAQEQQEVEEISPAGLSTLDAAFAPAPAIATQPLYSAALAEPVLADDAEPDRTDTQAPAPVYGPEDPEATAATEGPTRSYASFGEDVETIKWEDLTEAIPAFLTLVAMPLTFSIANGLALGFIFYPLLKVLTGRWREASPLVYVLAVLFILRYVYLGTE